MRLATALTLILAIASIARADQTTTFEDFGLPSNSKLNNAGASGGFVSGGNFFNNSYDSTFSTWSGWSISTMTDKTTPGYLNQYSAIPGSGANGSATYAVADPFGFPTDPFHPTGSYINLAAGSKPLSIDVTNTTYAYFSMLQGDSFARAFGPGDYFLVDIRGYDGLAGTGKMVGEVDFYLANFLGSNRLIVSTWTTLDLSSLASAKSLVFGLRSSDSDPNFGMNTPAYFAADNLRTAFAHAPEPTSRMLMALGACAAGCWLWLPAIRRLPLLRPGPSSRTPAKSDGDLHGQGRLA